MYDMYLCTKFSHCLLGDEDEEEEEEDWLKILKCYFVYVCILGLTKVRSYRGPFSGNRFDGFQHACMLYTS